MAPIFLPRTEGIRSSDDAGTLITKIRLPHYEPGPYTSKLLPEHLKPPEDLLYVPTLAYFCIKSLVQNVDAIDLGGMARVPHQDALLKGLIPFFDAEIRDTDLKYVDPRLWAALIQLYSSLPECFSTYTLPLSDTHLTTLQGIRSTSDFTFITVLDLASCNSLSDDTIGELKPLTNLCVLDLSGTRVGSWGVKKLSMCLVGRGAERRGPWGIRVWSLRGCRRVDDTVKDALAKFPLLSTVDLRDTSVTPSSSLSGFNASPPASHDSFYYPNPPLSWIPAISDNFPHCWIFESRASPHILHINKLKHPRNQPPEPPLTVSTLIQDWDERLRRSGMGEQDRVLALLPDGRQALHTGHSLAEEAAWRQREKEYRRGAEQRGYRWPGWSHSYGDLDNGFREDDYDNDAGALDLGLEGGPYDDWSESEDDEGGESLLWKQHIAALEAARTAAEQAARTFYAANTLRLRGGAHPMELVALLRRQPSHERLETQSGSEPLRAGRQTRLTDEESDRSLMFFRAPPAFDCVPDAACNVGMARRKKDDEVISAKRRKTGVGAGQVLLNRLGAASPHIRQETGRPATAPTQLWRGSTDPRAMLSQRSQNEGTPSPSLSMNPFLAKKKVPSHGHIPTLAAGLGPSFASGSSEPSTLPAMFAATTNNLRLTKHQSKAGPKTQPVPERHLDADKKSQGGAKGKGNQRFDMKGWATKPKSTRT